MSKQSPNSTDNAAALTENTAAIDNLPAYKRLLAFVPSTGVGFMLDGVILQVFDWPVLFQLNIPLGITAEAGALVLQWAFALFVIPVTLCLWALREPDGV